MLSLLLLGTVIRKPGSVITLILIAFLGVIMVMAPDLRGVKSPSMSGYMAVFAGVFFAALYVVISSRLVHRIAPVALLTGQLLFCCLLSVPLLLPTVEFALLTPGIILMAAIAGMLQYYLAFHLYLVSMKMIPVHIAGMMLYLVPVFSIMMAWLILGERLSSIQMFGCLVILGAIAILNHRQASENAAEKFWKMTGRTPSPVAASPHNRAPSPQNRPASPEAAGRGRASSPAAGNRDNPERRQA